MKTWTTSNGTKVSRALFGRSNIFIIQRDKTRVLVDTGWSGDRRRLLRFLSGAGPPTAVILTHTHFDHTGNAGAVDEQYHVPFIVQESEAEFLRLGNSPIPGGTNRFTRFIRRLGADRVSHWFSVPGVNPDITFGEHFDLHPFGLNAYILHTPGHSPGSCSVIVENEIVVAGDSMHGMGHSAFSPWGDDPSLMMKSWALLLATGSKLFLPAHGFEISKKKLEREYRKGGTR
jgi:glyoxylase-like metal-dependent hydrolase (beta-lactamase superfamily II)